MTTTRHRKPRLVNAPAGEGIQRVATHLHIPQAPLVAPALYGYLHVAAEIDRVVWPFRLGPDSAAKREAIAQSIELANRLQALDEVVTAQVFIAHLALPGAGRRMMHPERRHVRVARYDLVVLIRAKDLRAAAVVQENSVFGELTTMLAMHAKHLHIVRASNQRRMGDVDGDGDGVFLFNYFHGDDPTKLIPVWEYTAGWFREKTGLDNSELLVPVADQGSHYGIINHCRWDRWRDFLPDLRFRPSFRTFVMGHFDANGVVPMPILYRLATASGLRKKFLAFHRKRRP